MFNQWRSLFGNNGQFGPVFHFGGGNFGRGGNDDPDKKASDPNNDDDGDPFENFDFNRFRPKRKDPLNSNSPLENTPAKNEKNASDNAKDSTPPDNENKARTSGSSGRSDNTSRTSGRSSSSDETPRTSSTGSNRPRSNFGGRGGGMGNVPVNLPQVNLPRPSRRAIFLIVIGVLIVVLFIALPTIANFWTDVIWFQHIGQVSVFWTNFWAQILTFLAGGIVTFIVIMLNVIIARRFGPKGPLISANPDNVLAALIGGSVRLLNWAFIIGALIISLILAGVSSGEWQTFLIFFNHVPWNQTEKIFNLPIGYYMFELPFWQFLQGWLVGLLIVTAVAVVIVYALNFALSGRRFSFSPAIKTHLSILGALLLGLFAWGYQLSNNELVYSTRGVVPGASATDVEAQYPANNILTVIVALAAIVLLINIFIRNNRLGIGLLAGAIIVWLGGSILVGSIYPSVYQSFSVKPNEITKEAKYISNTISMTRQAFGVDNIQVNQINGNGSLTQADIQNSPYIQQNARLWDYGVTQQVYDRKETLKTYYTFDDVDIDRYQLDLSNTGKAQETQVLISPRELNYSGVSQNVSSWQNLHLQFTHGYGYQASPVNTTDAARQPTDLINQNFPFSTTNQILNVQQPRIYFGSQFQDGTDYAIVDTSVPEFDYPFVQDNTKNAEYQYDAANSEGIKLDNFFLKLAFASKLGDFNLLISDALNSNSQLLMRRNITDRAKLIAPFLEYDPDPYIVAVDGQLYWIQDAYTTSSLYPHGDSLARLGGSDDINYIRNSVKVVTNAYDGSVTFYMADVAAPDPLVHTYAQIYPGLFKPFDAMPAGLKAHLRYPEALLTDQSEVYLTYHVTDPTVYYTRNDLWQIPNDPAKNNGSGKFSPYYLVTQLPGQSQSEFALIQPFEPQNKTNLISLLAARSDGANYGKLVAYDFSGASNLFGPEQVFSLIQSNPQFSQQVTLLGQRGSQLTYGNLLIFPVNNSVLYVLPVYLSAENNPIPSLQFVAAAALASSGTNSSDTQLKTIFSSDLQTALNNVVTAGSTATAPPTGTTTGNTSTTPGAASTALPIVTTPVGTPGAAVTPQTVAGLIQAAQTHFANAQAALTKGDQTTYQSEYQAGEADLQQARELLGGS